jgi:hypothetical protein
MQPDGAWNGLSKGVRKKSEALAQGPDVTEVPQATSQQIE